MGERSGRWDRNLAGRRAGTMTPGGEATPDDDAQHPGDGGRSQGAARQDAPSQAGGRPSDGAPVPGEAADDPLLTPSEVAEMFRVNPKTVTRWARAGKLTAIRTLGGHRRFRASEIQRCLEEMASEDR